MAAPCRSRYFSRLFEHFGKVLRDHTRIRIGLGNGNAPDAGATSHIQHMQAFDPLANWLPKRFCEPLRWKAVLHVQRAKVSTEKNLSASEGSKTAVNGRAASHGFLEFAPSFPLLVTFEKRSHVIRAFANQKLRRKGT